MRELLEARVVIPSLPPGGDPLDERARLVLHRRASGWHIEAPFQEEVLPVARWLREQGILEEIDDSESLAIEALPSGKVGLQLHASRESVERFLAWIGPELRDMPRVRRLAPDETDAPTLTDLQEDALRRAVALGYYHIPRAIHLSDLATKLGVSSAALSERLRRAEGRLVVQHIGRRDAQREANGRKRVQPDDGAHD